MITVERKARSGYVELWAWDNTDPNVSVIVLYWQEGPSWRFTADEMGRQALP